MNAKKMGFVKPQVLIVALVIAAPLAWVVYTFATLSLGGGIEQVGDFKRVDLKSMGNFPFDDVIGTEKDVPDIYHKLDGQKVLLIGQMYSDFAAASRVDRFQLVYSIQNCCFNGPPKVQERVFAHTPKGKTVPIADGLAKVYGTLHVRTQRENGKVVSLYDMDVERVVAE